MDSRAKGIKAQFLFVRSGIPRFLLPNYISPIRNPIHTSFRLLSLTGFHIRSLTFSALVLHSLHVRDGFKLIMFPELTARRYVE
jgi:hypothetical protein